MTVPKQRKTKSRRNKRRMHIYLRPAVLSICQKCGIPKISHAMCWNCGFYKGREVINVLEKLTKKEKKQREKEMKMKEMEETRETGEGKPLSWEQMSKK